MSGFVPLKTNGELFRPRNVNVNEWGKDGLVDLIGKSGFIARKIETSVRPSKDVSTPPTPSYPSYPIQ